MTAMLKVLTDSGAGDIWIDHLDYSLGLLRGGDAAFYADPAQLAHFIGEVQALLEPAILDFDLGRFLSAWAGDGATAGDDLVTNLENLMADSLMRQDLCECLVAVRGAVPQSVSLVIRLPAWSFFSALGAAGPGAEERPLDAEDREMLVLYLTDLLRSLNHLPVSGLLLQEEDYDPEDYEVLVNMAAGYGWSVGLVTSTSPSAVAGLDFVIGPPEMRLPADAPPVRGICLAGENLSVNSAEPGGSAAFRYWRLAAGLNPDKVLAVRRALRR